MFILRLLSNRNIIFALALVLGLALGDRASWARILTIPALAIVMTVSMTQLPLSTFISKGIHKPILWSIALNYVLFGSVTLLLAWKLVPDVEMWYGFVIVALAPPGVAIAPFSKILSGNVRYALIGVIGAYFASLLIIPAASMLLIGGNAFDPFRLLLILVQLIIGPFIVSRLLIRFKISIFINKLRPVIVNWGLFVVIFTVIALNRNLLFEDPGLLARASIVASVPIFGIGFLLDTLLHRTDMPTKNISSFVLFGTVKNGGFAAASALALFGEGASLPGAVTSIFIIIYLIVLTLRAGRTTPR